MRQYYPTYSTRVFYRGHICTGGTMQHTIFEYMCLDILWYYTVRVVFKIFMTISVHFSWLNSHSHFEFQKFMVIIVITYTLLSCSFGTVSIIQSH